jgi:hypothetical protein
MPDILYRCELRNPDQARAVLKGQALPWIGAQLEQGHELVGEFRLRDDDITKEQRGYLHGGVFAQIADEAIVNGQKFPMEVWKEWYRNRFLGFNVVTCIDPFTGKRSRRRVRISTEDLGKRGLAEYTERVIAHASTDLGLTIRPPMKKEVREAMKRFRALGCEIDAETGEITEAA